MLVVELEGSAPRGRPAQAELAAEILRRAPPAPTAEPVRDVPVEVRHNAKIKRGELERWAERRLARR